MAEERTLLLGIDITDEYVMLSYFNEAGDHVCASLEDNATHYRIPAAICRLAGEGGQNEWVFGQKALYAKEVNKNLFFDHFLTGIKDDEIYCVSEQSLTCVTLLESFFRLVLRALQKLTGGLIIKGIAVTCESSDEKVLNGIKEAFEGLGIGSDRFRIVSRSEAFMNFILSQNRNISINDVGLVDFRSDSCVFYRLSFKHNVEPLVIVAEKSDVSDRLSMDMLQGDEEKLVYNFKTTMTQLFGKQPLSAVYFTGVGFESTWADETLKGFCVSDRRIFKGQNLYVMGAGNAAAYIYNDDREEHVFIDENGLQSSIAIRAYKDGDFEEVMLANIGQPYTTAGAQLEVILEDTNEIALIIHNVRKKDYKCAIMTLETMAERADKTVRMQIRLRFPDRDNCIVTVKDMGFGEIHDTNYRIWEQIIKL